MLVLAMAGSAQTPSPSPSATPPPSNVVVADLSSKDGQFKVGKPLKINETNGYNNQPSWLADGQSLLYTSIRNKQADIYRYDIRSGATTQVTNTAESEYSPTLMPDGKSISVVRVEADGTQRLWKFPLAGGTPALVLQTIKPVGYHWWIDDHTLALFILGGSGKPNTLQIVDTRTEKAEVIAENPGRIIRLVPHENRLSFVQKISAQEWLVKAFDLKTRQTVTLIRTFAGMEDFAWTPSGILVMARDAKLYKWDPKKDQDWQEFADLSPSGLRRITRLAVNAKGDKIAFVALQ
jgi:dipeptidyl aminopeptidase/acylaminoacyl peptidase